MSFAVDIVKRVRSGQRQFALAVKLNTRAQRTVVYGPSGAGKSLLLQLLGGLLTPDAGRISYGDEAIYDSAMAINVPARRRRFGFLFQDYALFPQLNVRQNIAFGLRPGLLNPAVDVNDAAVERWLRAFELEDVAQQRPDELSGGQRQRTALARALVNSPRALLLDEPFSALDPELRERMRLEMDRLLSRLSIPLLMITHDPDDLDWFGEEVFHLRDGAICDAPLPLRSVDVSHTRRNVVQSEPAATAGGGTTTS